MSIPNWPPPVAAITYTVECKANSVYRVEGAEILSIKPIYEAGSPELLGKLGHLIDAIESLGLEFTGIWAGYSQPLAGSRAKVVAWAI